MRLVPVCVRRRWVAFLARARGYEPFWAEVWSGGAGILWGLYSILDPEPLASNPAYRDLTAAVPALVWELGAIGGGLLQIAAVVSNKRDARWTTAFLMAAWWGVPVHAIVTSPSPVSPAVGAYLGWIGVNCTTVWCLSPGAWLDRFLKRREGRPAP